MSTSTQPTELPEWADGGSAVIIEPTSGKKSVGFGEIEKPAGGVFNWLFKTIYLWLVYLKAVFTNGGGAVGQMDLGYPVETSNTPAVFTAKTWTLNVSPAYSALTAHGFVNGQGPVTVSSTVTLPTGISAATNYWIRVRDVNSFWFCSSFANAMNGTELTSLSGGSGTFSVVGAAATAPTVPPLQVTRDWVQNIRGKVDHLGYRSGQVIDWEEQWRTTSTTAPAGWTFAVTSTAVASIQNAASSGAMQERSVKLIPGGSGGNITVTPGDIGYFNNNTALSIEFMVLTDTAVSGSGTNFRVGLTMQGSGDNGVYFGAFNAVTNWACYRRVAGTETPVDSGVAYAANTQYRFRIEVLGSANTSQATGTYEYRFYINGVLVTVLDFTSPGPDTFRPWINYISSSTANDFYIGRMKLQWNQLLSGDSV